MAIFEETPTTTSVVCHKALPEIDIKIEEPARAFLRRVASIGKANGNFEVKTHFNALRQKGYHVVNFRFLGKSPHTSVGGLLICNPSVMGRVQVEMTAERWFPDPVTRVAYIEAARNLIQPLLASFNQTYSKRYRLRIENAVRAKPKLPPKTAEAFYRFADLANTSSLHSNDWKRFYEFVRLSRTKLSQDHIRSLLIDKGFSIQKSDEISEIYNHIWNYKTM